LDGDAQSALFAHCASFAVNAVHEPANRYNQGRVSAHGTASRLEQASVLAGAVGLDMVQAGWRPAVGNYLGRITKPRILEAVREAKGEASAQLIGYLKKADMAREAERLLEGTGWLPEPLRLADAETQSSGRDGEAGPLPEFLAEDEDSNPEVEVQRPDVAAG
jgi:ParB family chromosome partitioning protein